MKPRLLAYLASPGLNSPRVRFLNYLPMLEQHFAVLRRGGRPDKEAFGLGPADILFIQKKLPRLWWTLLASRSVKARVVYDFDDAIWTDPKNPGSWMLVRREARLAALLKRCDLVTTANQFLGDYARRLTPRVEVIPIAVPLPEVGDMPEVGMPDLNEPARIGWAGHPVGQYLLKTIEPQLREFLLRRPQCRFIVLSGTCPDLDVPFEWWPYSPDAEERFLREIDLGLVPSSNSTFDLGKTPLKAIRHFSYGRPVVTNGLGATREVVDESTGYLVDGPEGWLTALDRAIDHPAERAAKGLRARARVLERHEAGTVGARLVEQLVALSNSAG